MCAANEEDVKTFSHNDQVPSAKGMRTDSKDSLMRIIDHLDYAMHKEAERLDELAKN